MAFIRNPPKVQKPANCIKYITKTMEVRITWIFHLCCQAQACDPSHMYSFAASEIVVAKSILVEVPAFLVKGTAPCLFS